jgi:hypothetical protein
MVFLDFLTATGIAVLFTLVFAVGVGGHRRGEPLMTFFLLLLFLTWAGGLWLKPMTFGGQPAPWLGYLLAGLIFAALLAVLIAPAPRRRPGSTAIAAKSEGQKEFIALNLVFVLFILVLILAIVGGYLT